MRNSQLFLDMHVQLSTLFFLVHLSTRPHARHQWVDRAISHNLVMHGINGKMGKLVTELSYTRKNVGIEGCVWACDSVECSLCWLPGKASQRESFFFFFVVLKFFILNEKSIDYLSPSKFLTTKKLKQQTRPNKNFTLNPRGRKTCASSQMCSIGAEAKLWLFSQ